MHITKVKNISNHRLPDLASNVGYKLQKNPKSKILSSGWQIDIKKRFKSVVVWTINQQER